MLISARPGESEKCAGISALFLFSRVRTAQITGNAIVVIRVWRRRVWHSRFFPGSLLPITPLCCERIGISLADREAGRGKTTDRACRASPFLSTQPSELGDTPSGKLAGQSLHHACDTEESPGSAEQDAG